MIENKISSTKNIFNSNFIRNVIEMIVTAVNQDWNEFKLEFLSGKIN